MEKVSRPFLLVARLRGERYVKTCAKPGTRGFNLSCCNVLCDSVLVKLSRDIGVPNEVHLDLARNTDFYSLFVNVLIVSWLLDKELSRAVPGHADKSAAGRLKHRT